MENKNTNPIKLARELGFSIINSTEYITLKKLEEEIINSEISLNLLKSIEAIQSSNDNSTSIENLVLDSPKTQEIQSEINDSTIIKQYLEGKKSYEKLLKNVFNIIEYMTGEIRATSSSSNGCCGQCHNGCAGCEK